MQDKAYEAELYYREFEWNQGLMAKRLKRVSSKQDIGGSNQPNTLIFKAEFQTQ